MRWAHELGRRTLKPHASKFSRKDFTLPQLFACLVLREILGLSFRDIEAVLRDADRCRRLGIQFLGLSGVAVQNNFFGGTYHSATTTSPTHATVQDGATVGSNGAVTAGSNERLGAVILGPAGTSNLTTADGTTVLPQPLAFALPVSPGPAAGDVSVSGGTHYIAGGTYYTDDLTIGNGCALVFTGPTVVYFSGNVKFTGDVSIGPASGVPGDLKIYHTAAGGSFGSATANNVSITADVYCPGCDLAVKNNAVLTGRFVFKTVVAKNNLDFYYDDSLPPLYINGPGGGTLLVHRAPTRSARTR